MGGWAFSVQNSNVDWLFEAHAPWFKYKRPAHPLPPIAPPPRNGNQGGGKTCKNFLSHLLLQFVLGRSPLMAWLSGLPSQFIIQTSTGCFIHMRRGFNTNDQRAPYPPPPPQKPKPGEGGKTMVEPPKNWWDPCFQAGGSQSPSFAINLILSCQQNLKLWPAGRLEVPFRGQTGKNYIQNKKPLLKVADLVQAFPTLTIHFIKNDLRHKCV